jgi:hypothetical protein
MATFMPHLQKSFKMKVEDGVPQATVELVGTVYWLRCCPLCGSVHQVPGGAEEKWFTPLCQTQPNLYKAELAAWHKEFPESAQYTSLQLVKK